MSEEFIKKLNKEITKNENLEDKEIKLNRFQFYKKSNILKVVLKCKESLVEEEEKWLVELVKRNLGFNINVELLVYKDVEGASATDIVNKYWSNVVLNIVKKNPLSKNVLYSKHKIIDEDIITIKYGSEAIINHLKKKDIERKVSAQINDIFGKRIRIKLEYDKELEDDNYEEKKALENKKIVDDVLQGRVISEAPKAEKKEKKAPQKKNTNEGYQKYKREPKGENTILGRNISQEAIKISEIDETSGYVAIIGEVFKTEIIETRTGKMILTFYITDYTSSITVKCFLKDKDKEEVLENVKKGLYCKVRGEAIYDTYAREVVIMGRDIVKMKKIERMDAAEEKRVELHLHTNMSTMDGMVSASRMVERAAKWGHSAIAITDHGVVHLETTGFSAKNDKIIEIGAVKIEEGKIVDRFSEFVNPEKLIPYKITELTGITDEMVKDSETIESILPRFLEFCKGSVLVAHNAAFDTGFIKNNCNRMNLEFDFTIMDTVPLARFLYPELKKVKLNIVAKHLGISLENHHRAVDDAKATCDILIKCFEKLKEEKEIFDLAM